MAWHENMTPAIRRAERRRKRLRFIQALNKTTLSQEEKAILVKLYDQGH